MVFLLRTVCGLSGRSLWTQRSGIHIARGNAIYDMRSMRRSDIQVVYDLLAGNNWNMKKSELECIFNSDPSGLVVVVKEDGQVIGHIGTLNHSRSLASSGMFIVKEKYRGLQVGRKLFRQVMDVSGTRNVGGYADSHMIYFYAHLGLTIKSYTFHHNKGPVNQNFIKDPPMGDLEIINAREIDFNDVIAYDSEIHTVPRPVYISNWAEHESAITLVALRKGRVVGYGVLRPAAVGYKMYPLYADDPKIAKCLFSKLASNIPTGEDLIFTQPIENSVANEFVEANNFVTHLSMTRLYSKHNVPVDIKRVYSLSTTSYGII